MKPSEQEKEPLEPHELAGEMTHEQRAELADGLVALFRRKEAEDAASKAARGDAAPRQ